MKRLCLIVFAALAVLAVVSAVVTLVGGRGVSLAQKVALVRIEGPIVDSKDAVEEIRDYADDPSIKGIVIRVDSPGGAVAPSQEIFEEVTRAAEVKSVVVSMGSLAASGGYYISAPATRIVANPGTITGSIGVIMEIPNIQGLMDKLGIKTQVVKSGEHKDLASMFRELGPEERGILQGVLDDVHEQFISAVAEGRGMPVEVVKELADGRVFTGRQAKELGLVDELGNLQDAIDLSAELSGIEGKPEVVTRKEKLSVVDFLRGEISSRIAEVFPPVRLQYLLSP
ncbi:MAG: signal peptide peptidase SppA [Thermodesulfovibrionales bacterium]